MVIQLKVQSPEGQEKIIDLCDNEEQMKKTTVKQLKQIIAKTFMTDDNLQLAYGTKFLDDRARLVSYKITHMSSIQAILKLPGGI